MNIRPSEDAYRGISAPKGEDGLEYVALGSRPCDPVNLVLGIRRQREAQERKADG